MTHRHRVVVVGGGLAGLVTAHWMANQPSEVDVVVLESDIRVGGKLRTDEVEGFRVEAGADGFVEAAGEVGRLAAVLGIEDEIIPTRPTPVRAYERAGREFQPLLGGGDSPLSYPRSLLRNTRLSAWGRGRVLFEPLIPRRRSGGDESVRRFLSRRLGRGAYETVLQPLLAGVYGADPGDLSAAATLQHLVAAEASGRSLVAGIRPTTTEASVPFRTFRDGMAHLPDVLRAAIGPGRVQAARRVMSVRKLGARWRVTSEDGRVEDADHVVLATPASVSADLVVSFAHLARELRSLSTGRCAVVNLAYPASAVPRALDAHGYLNARGAGRAVSACTWSSSKFEGRAPGGHVLLRGFVRGDTVPDEGQAGVAELERLVREELADSLGVSTRPLWCRVRVWSTPVYRVGHPDRVTSIRDRLAQLPGLSVVGASYDGVGVPSVIRSARLAAEDVVRSLEGGTGG